MHPRRTINRTRVLFALIGAVAATSPIALPAQGAPAAAAPAPPTLSPPEDKRPSWVVGFAALEPLDLAPENLYLAYSIPLVVREKLAGIREHLFAEEELRFYREELVKGRVREVSALLNKQRRERDALAAGGPASPRALRDLEKKEEQIDLLTRQVRYLEELDLAEVVVGETKPVSFRSSQPGGSAATGDSGGLLPSPRYSPLQTARSAGLDLLVFGTIQQVQDYLFVTVRAIDFPRGEVLLDYQDAFGPPEVYGSLAELADELAGVVMGREWGRLRVSSQPSDAEIRVNGEFAGIGESLLAYVPPGELDVSVERQGYRGVREKVVVAPGAPSELAVALEPEPAVMLSLTSSPLLADVYLDSRLVGRTPVEVPRPAGLERVELRKEGFEGRSFHLSPTSPLETVTVLPPRIFDPDERQKRGRDAFYLAAGVWALSLPLPLYFWAVSLDQVTAYQGAAQAGDAREQLELLVRYRRLYAGYLGGLFVNLSLLTNVVIGLIRYVASADRPAG